MIWKCPDCKSEYKKEDDIVMVTCPCGGFCEKMEGWGNGE